MSTRRFDVLIVGAGPAGSVAALVLARAGARVALVDKSAFPRDKACGDLIGPHGVQLLADLDIPLANALPVGDMVVVGPAGRKVRLPAFPGRTYPGHALAVPRRRFDTALRDAALDAGAEAFVGRAADPLFGDAGLEGFVLSTGAGLRADIVVGADGATSRVATVADLVDRHRVLWAFALRAYIEERVDWPHIAFWEPTRGHAFPGYGWLFPGPDGCSNLGLGVGMRSTRTAAAAVTRQLPAFVGYLRDIGLLHDTTHTAPLGGWLKLGMIGTNPAHGRVLLVGDAAGLVNPLQGEGISPALTSGHAAAQAILTDPPSAALHYRKHLRTNHAAFMASAAPAHTALLTRPRAISTLGRVLTAPLIGTAIAGAWSLTWNDLRAGATPRPSAAIAATVAGLSRLATAHSDTTHWITRTLGTQDVFADRKSAPDSPHA